MPRDIGLQIRFWPSNVDRSVTPAGASPINDQLEAAVVQAWRAEGYAATTMWTYLVWVRRFRKHCCERGLREIELLTRQEVLRFATQFAEERHLARRSTSQAIRAAKIALRRWAATLQVIGLPVPSWRPPRRARPFDKLLSEYCEFGRQWRAVKTSSLRSEARQVRPFLLWLRSRRKRLTSLTPGCIDEFLTQYGGTVRPRTLASVSFAVRSFLRFLHATGRVRIDLAPYVEGPQVRKHASPPRALRWDDVRRILARIDRATLTGKRDHAMFLMMAAYGMGASEVLDLRLDDIDWQEGTLHIVRRKTGVHTLLPLLGPVGKALASYLQFTRRHRTVRQVFVQALAPFHPLSFGGLAARWARYASSVGVSFRGTHALRHTHATRQVEAAAPPKVVSDILGHRDPSSLSVYARVATERLRAVCLPLP